MREDEARLDRLWEAYRKAAPDPEVSPNFMPELWARIEAARPVSWVEPLTRWAWRLVPVAAGLTLAMSLYIWNPISSGAALPGYVEVLAADLMEDQQPALWLAGMEDNI